MDDYPTTEDPAPRIPESVVIWLETVFRHVTPNIDWPDRKIWLHVGQRRVVDLLRTEYDRQRASPVL